MNGSNRSFVLPEGVVVGSAVDWDALVMFLTRHPEMRGFLHQFARALRVFFQGYEPWVEVLAYCGGDGDTLKLIVNVCGGDMAAVGEVYERFERDWYVWHVPEWVIAPRLAVAMALLYSPRVPDAAGPGA